MERSQDPTSTKWVAVPTCDPVRVALQTFSFLIRGVIDPFSDSIEEEHRGNIFQDCFRDTLSYFSTCRIKLFDYGTRTEGDYSFSTTRLAYNVASLASPRPPVSGTCSFWLNGIERFPGFDFAWIDVISRTVCLISVSISSVNVHEGDKDSPLIKAMTNSFDVGTHKVTQPGLLNTFTKQSSTALLLSWLTGISWKTQYNVRKDKKPSLGTMDAEMDPLPPPDQRWRHHFIFFSGHTEEKKSSRKLTNLLVAGPESSAAFLHAPLESVKAYLNKLEAAKQKKTAKFHPPDESAVPPGKRAKAASMDEMDED